MSTDQNLEVEQQRFHDFAESREWWMQEIDIIGGTGRILRYPHLFGAVYERCKDPYESMPFAEVIDLPVGSLCPSCRGSGYVVRSVADFWWKAPGALEKDGFHPVIYGHGVALYNAVVVEEPHSGWHEGRHPVLALIEALEQVLPAKVTANG